MARLSRRTGECTGLGYTGTLHINGDQSVCRTALEALQDHYPEKRYRTGTLQSHIPVCRPRICPVPVPADEVTTFLKNFPVQVIDTGYAIHLQSLGVNKGTALLALAKDMGLHPSDFLAIGDSLNDLQMLKTAGMGITVANAHPGIKAVAAYVSEKEYGSGFVDALKKYEPYLRAR